MPHAGELQINPEQQVNSSPRSVTSAFKALQPVQQYISICMEETFTLPDVLSSHADFSPVDVFRRYQESSFHKDFPKEQNCSFLRLQRAGNGRLQPRQSQRATRPQDVGNNLNVPSCTCWETAGIKMGGTASIPRGWASVQRITRRFPKIVTSVNRRAPEFAPVTRPNAGRTLARAC